MEQNELKKELKKVYWQILELVQHNYPEKKISHFGGYIYRGQEKLTNKTFVPNKLDYLTEEGYLEEYKSHHFRLSQKGWGFMIRVNQMKDGKKKSSQGLQATH